MADVEALCQRVIVIHHGRILFDGQLGGARATRSPPTRRSGSRSRTAPAISRSYGEVVHTTVTSITLRVPKAETARVTARLLAEQEVLDLNVEDPPIEDVIELVFAQERPE